MLLTMLERNWKKKSDDSSRQSSVQQPKDNRQVQAVYLKARSPVSTASGYFVDPPTRARSSLPVASKCTLHPTAWSEWGKHSPDTISCFWEAFKKEVERWSGGRGLGEGGRCEKQDCLGDGLPQECLGGWLKGSITGKMEGVAEASSWDLARDGWAWGNSQAGQRGCLRGQGKDRGSEGCCCQVLTGKGLQPSKGKALAGDGTGCLHLVAAFHPSALLHLGWEVRAQVGNPHVKGIFPQSKEVHGKPFMVSLRDPCPKLFTRSSPHPRIIESFGSEGTPRGHLVQPPRSEQGHH